MRLFTRSTAAGATTDAYLSDPDLFDQAVDQRTFDFDRRLTRRTSIVPDGQWLADRNSGASLVEMIEAEPVAEQIGNPLIEAIELRQAVFAQRNQKADINVLAIDGTGECHLEAVGVRGFRVVEEIFFELVEDDEHSCVRRLGAGSQNLVQWHRQRRLRLIARPLPRRFDAGAGEHLRAVA